MPGVTSQGIKGEAQCHISISQHLRFSCTHWKTVELRQVSKPFIYIKCYVGFAYTVFDI